MKKINLVSVPAETDCSYSYPFQPALRACNPASAWRGMEV